MIVCREAEVNIWTRLQSYDGCAISHDVVRRRTTMAQHREKAVHMRKHAKIWYKYPRRRIASREVARHRAMSVRFSTISGIATRFLNMTKNRQDVVLGPSMAATSYNIARFTPDGPRYPNFAHRRWSYEVRPYDLRLPTTGSDRGQSLCDHS